MRFGLWEHQRKSEIFCFFPAGNVPRIEFHAARHPHKVKNESFKNVGFMVFARSIFKKIKESEKNQINLTKLGRANKREI